MTVITPSVNEIEKYMKKWAVQENYVLQEKSLRKLFSKTYPENKIIEDVLIKVCALNNFYSTNIFSPFKVAKHIINLDIDKRLKQEDLNLVDDIARIRMGRRKVINFYSFATKYCSHHLPTVYPIYDYYVEKMILYFKKKDKFDSFKKDDLRQYPLYRDVLLKFRKFYGLNKFDLKKIDIYLWQAGKKYFTKSY